MLGFHAISEAPLSSLAPKVHSRLASSASVVANSTVSKLGISLAIGPVSMTAVGKLVHAAGFSGTGTASTNPPLVAGPGLLKASLKTLAPFSSGFGTGFLQGSHISADGIISQNFLDVSAALSASGTVEKLGEALLAGEARLTDFRLECTGSLVANSVLLIGGKADLSTASVIQPRLLGQIEEGDLLNFILNVDKLRGLTGYIDKTRSMNLYVDKQRSVDGHVDQILSHTKYIDKQVDKVLIRER